jgi:hypothetical protein
MHKRMTKREFGFWGLSFSDNFTANSISKKHGICDVGNIVERKIKVNDSFG